MFTLIFADSAQNYLGMAAVVAVFIFVSILLFFVKRYQRCPSNKIMVIYGRSQEMAEQSLSFPFFKITHF